MFGFLLECEADLLSFITKRVSRFPSKTGATATVSSELIFLGEDPFFSDSGNLGFSEKIPLRIFRIESDTSLIENNISFGHSLLYRDFFSSTSSLYEKKRDISYASCFPISDGGRSEDTH